LNIYDDAKALLNQRKRAYELTFNTESNSVKTVLQDLAEFCRAGESTFHTDPRIHAALEGRREVWLRIQKYIQSSPDELWELTRKG
jgi:hypothetical protein